MKASAVIILTALAGLAGCAPMGSLPPDPEGTPSRLNAAAAAKQFAAVVSAVEPVADSVCQATRQDDHCDFRIAIDGRRRQPPNAFQTVDDEGDPVLIFTLALISDMRNPDELAFVMSHEASHHILDHLAKQAAHAEEEARVYAEVAARNGASEDAIRKAGEVGAAFGAHSYSRQYELEADYLGTRIARAAGFDPLKGALYFDRLPDPSGDFLGTHPPNAQRMQTVRASMGLAPCPNELDLCN
ncbi:M48 family metallopeptidase [Pseudooceanicola sp. HF7]|uniref:M48 family metallopeptidase n=1 Tax=Pseudooceanicola sp. HF7 TaxID=2721560 RepID=UPI0020CA775E|nr:M48 family metallopeptidase [Pseudooceanicola sp. HF7]